MRVKLLGLVFAAALVSTGAAFNTQAQASRKATPRPTPTPAVQQPQPKKVTQRPEDVKGS